MIANDACILLVDDDEDARDLVAQILRREGLAVACAADGLQALGVLRNSKALPNVILLDLSMAKMGGCEFRRAQKADPALAPIPVVVLTAEDRAWDLIDADLFLEKPCAHDDVVEAVLRFCRAASVTARPA